MSPIFVRPVREQLEHDRLIRHLVLKYKRKFEAVANVGDEQVAPVRLGTGTYYPDVVLMEGKKLAGVIEVETAESVNNLEAMAQWVPFSRSRVPFHLYVPVHTYDVARRFCESHQAAVTEIWTYRAAADGFDLVRSFYDANAAARKPVKMAGPPVKAVAILPPKPAPTAKPAPAAAKSAVAAKPAAAVKPAAAAKAAAKPPAKPVGKVPAKPAAKPEVKPAKAAPKPASASKPAAKPAAKKPAKAKSAPARKR